MRRRALSLLCLVLGLASNLTAQGTSCPAGTAAAITHVLRTKEGSTFVGCIVEQSADSIRFATSGGTLTLPRTAVAELKAVNTRDIHNGEYWFPNPNATRLFFAPTGRMLRQGEGYYSNTLLVLNGVSGGITDRVSIGGTATLIPGTTDQVGYLTPKIGVFASDNVNVAVGGLVAYSTISDESDLRRFGFLYSVATVGSPDASATAGIGWGYAGSSLVKSPAIMLGGAVRMSRRTAFVTENYFASSTRASGAFLGYGIRFFGEKLSVDLALVNSVKEPIFPGVPFVSFSVDF
ncbi:MAG: hypothetical protein ACHQWU_17380 [Gemmatimonadales bacterium]|jgi:hypothetical protein